MSMQKKDFELYPKYTKSMDIFILRGNAINYKKHGCEFNFYNIKDLTNMLKDKIKATNQKDIKSALSNIYKILKRSSHKKIK